MNSETKLRAKVALDDVLMHHIDNTIYERMLDIYEEIFRADYDLIVCVARRSYDLFLAFSPLIKKRVGAKKFRSERVAHSLMVAAWWVERKPDNKTIKVAVLDDVVIHGAALGQFLGTFRDRFDVPPSNISVFAFLRRKGDRALETIESFFLQHHGDTAIHLNSSCLLYDHNELKHHSKALLRAIHATSTPYSGYMAAFVMSLDEATDPAGQEKIFSRKPTIDDGFDESFLCKHISGGYDVRDITTRLLHESGISAFCLFSKEKSAKDSDCLFPHLGGDVMGAERVSAIRCYINTNMNKLLVEPYSTLFSCKAGNANDSIRRVMPSALRRLCEIEESASADEKALKETKLNYPSDQIAHRMLRYARSYMIGRHFLRSTGIRARLVTRGGIPSSATAFHRFLNGVSDGRNVSKPFQKTWRFIEDDAHRKVMSYNKGNEADAGKLMGLLGVVEDSAAEYGFAVSDVRGGYSSFKGFLRDGTGLNATDALFKHIVGAFNTLLDDTPDLNTRPIKDRFRGLPWGIMYHISKTLVEKVKGEAESGSSPLDSERFRFTPREFAAVVLRMGDFGAVITRVVCFNGVVGTVVCSGEGAVEGKDILNHGFAWALTEIASICKTASSAEKWVRRIYSEFAARFAEDRVKTLLSRKLIETMIQKAIDLDEAVDTPIALGELRALKERPIEVTYFYALMLLCEEYAVVAEDNADIRGFMEFAKKQQGKNPKMWGREDTIRFIIEEELLSERAV